MLWGHVIVQWLHVLLAVLWFGGTMFMALVVAPTLTTASAQAQEEIGAQIAQRMKKLFAPVGGLTILFGILNATFFGPIQSWDALWGSSYGVTVVVAVVLGIVLVVFGAGIGNKAATIANAPPEQRGSIIRQVMGMSKLQLLMFFVAFTLMVLLRYSI
jgi:copper resistance protein D